MEGASDISMDTLFVGLTRPTTVAGIPYIAFVAEFMVSGIAFLAVNNPLYMLMVIPIHAVLYLITANDPGIFASFNAWTKTYGRCLNTRFWGACSFSPVNTRKWLK